MIQEVQTTILTKLPDGKLEQFFLGLGTVVTLNVITYAISIIINSYSAIMDVVKSLVFKLLGFILTPMIERMRVAKAMKATAKILSEEFTKGYPSSQFQLKQKVIDRLGVEWIETKLPNFSQVYNSQILPFALSRIETYSKLMRGE